MKNGLAVENDPLERRARRRFPVALKCLLRFGKSAAVPAETKNISRTGMLVACEDLKSPGPKAVGNCLQVDVEVPPSEGAPQGFLRCICSVAWKAIDSGAVLLGLAISKMSFSEEAAAKEEPPESRRPRKDVVM